MKKLLLSLAMSIFGIMGMSAQEEQVATLVSGDNSTPFYGTEALVEAYAAAQNGDVITLSAGIFTAVDIEKAITLRGVGMRPTDNNGATITRLGGFTVNIPESAGTEVTLEDLKIEGDLSINGKDLVPVNLNRCYFGSPAGKVYGDFSEGGSRSVNLSGVYAKLVHCIMCYLNQSNSKAYLQSCYAYEVSGQVTMDNCNIHEPRGFENSVARNCIFSYWGNFKISNTNSVTYCICNGNGGASIFTDINSTTNKIVEFTWPTATYQQTFVLPEEVATNYLGDDGTQVGMLGGTNPFTDKSSNPQVKKLAVKSSAENGVLKVKIDVE